MKIFSCVGPDGFIALATGFNRGHAAKLLAKELENQKLEMTKAYVISEIDLEANSKGQVILLAKPD